MKRLLAAIIVCISVVGFSQVKSNGFDSPNVMDGIVSHDSSPLFGFLNSENFSMNHSYSMSYSSFGSNGLALGVYTNSMMYKFSSDLNVQLDASFVHSPYNTFGKDFQSSMNKFYISKAAINYQPWKDMHITFQYRNMPFYNYDPYYGNGYFGNSLFSRNESDFFFGR